MKIPTGAGSEIGRYSYSMIEKCSRCRLSGPDRPVDMCRDSASFGVCTPCRHGEEEAPPLRRKKRVVVEEPPPRRKKRVVA